MRNSAALQSVREDIAPTTVTAQELIDRAEALLPGIAARGLDAEHARRIPQETINEIRAAGLNRVMQPVEWGGFGLDIDTFFEISWRLSSACGSTGWVYSVAAMQNYEMAQQSHAVQADFYSKADVLSCSALNPRGARVESVEGGWMLSGRWQYASGCLHADWAKMGAAVPEFSDPGLLLVPKTDFRIDDTWHVSGLKGTGSHDIVIDEPIFVPRHRFMKAAPQRGPAVASDERGSYGAPYRSVSPWGVVTPVIGMAQGALNAYEAFTRGRVTAFSGKPVSHMVGAQLRVSEASAMIDAARAMARSTIAYTIERGSAGEDFTDECRVRIRRNHAYVVNLCYDATMMLSRAGGASSLFETNPIQRFMRDVHAASMQVVSNWDEQAESYGRVRMGLDPNGQVW